MPGISDGYKRVKKILRTTSTMVGVIKKINQHEPDY